MPPLRLMTYNVRYFGHGTRGLASTGAAFTRIANGLARLAPLADLVCLQEVETQSLRSNTMSKRAHPDETQLDRLMTELHAALAREGRPEQYTAYYFPAHAYRLTKNTNIYTTGLAILALSSLGVSHHNADTPHDITHRARVKNLKQTRICAHLTFRHRSGHLFDVFNTHLSLPSVFSKEFWTSEARMGFGPNQLHEAKTLADFVEREARSPYFVVLGDFNSLPGSPVDKYLQEERRLVDVMRKLRSWDDAAARAFPTAGFLNLRMHLDHVYSSPELEWLDCDGTEPFGRGAFDGLSDHAPLLMRCRIPDGGAVTTGARAARP